MAELPLAQGIDRFKQNEDRMDRFVNGGDSQVFVTSGGTDVPTIRKFLRDKSGEIDSETEHLLENKNQEINEAASGILNASRVARDKANDWAEKPEDQAVEPGAYSAKHHAIKASQSAQQVADDKAAVEAMRTDVEQSVTSADNSAEQAAAYADFARNNWAIAAFGNGSGAEDDIPLLVDPGSVNNMFVVVGGVGQLVTQDAYSLVYLGSAAFIRINVPLGAPYEVKVGNAVDVGVPPDLSVSTDKIANGAVSTSKLADKAVTFDKMQDIPATSIIGRKTAGTGHPEVLSVEDLLALLNLTPVVVDRRFSSYAANTALTVALPTDDTIPQITEGTEILKVTIAPKSVTNRLRARAVIIGSVSSVDNWAAALFAAGAANALHAVYAITSTANYVTELVLEWEWVPGVTTPIDIVIRAGSNPSKSLYLNGSSSGRIFGGAAHCTLVVEEIKA